MSGSIQGAGDLLPFGVTVFAILSILSVLGARLDAVVGPTSWRD